jgi:hypothetical protein
MKSITISAWLSLWLGLTAWGQTNSAPSCHGLLLLSETQLRDMQPESQSAPGAASAGQTVAVPAAPVAQGQDSMDARLRVVRMSLSAGADGFDADLLHKLEQDGCFARRPEPPTGVAKFADSVFRPEVISVGKTKFCCSLYTAIKRKNPLCLINPCFLNFSW